MPLSGQAKRPGNASASDISERETTVKVCSPQATYEIVVHVRVVGANPDGKFVVIAATQDRLDIVKDRHIEL